ncbi:MAG TPA: hypothetical protein VN694_14985 [Caulobacteraceae bacterium]|nr:hypothetical protein [Caulobacteraceae bacterium]
MRRTLAAAVAIALIASSAHAGVSSWCLWTQLHDLHAVEVRCAGPLPPEVESRYEGLRQAIEAAILRDASLRAGESAETAKAEMAQHAAKTRSIDPARCQDPDLKKAVMYFGILTSPETIAKLEVGLAERRDPYEGDCL